MSKRVLISLGIAAAAIVAAFLFFRKDLTDPDQDPDQDPGEDPDQDPDQDPHHGNPHGEPTPLEKDPVTDEPGTEETN